VKNPALFLFKRQEARGRRQEGRRNRLGRFLIEVCHAAIFILLLVPLVSGMGVYPENRGRMQDDRGNRRRQFLPD